MLNAKNYNKIFLSQNLFMQSQKKKSFIPENQNYRENIFIYEKFSVTYISKEREFDLIIILYLNFESNSYQKF